jgi:hypothetical protein
MAINQTCQSGEGRIMKLAAIGDFPLIEKGIVMLGGCLNGIMLWRIGLNDNLSP